jgi:hypothetical protein
MAKSVNRDNSKNNTSLLAEIHLDYAKTRLTGNSPKNPGRNDSMLECKFRRQDKDVKCQQGSTSIIKAYPERSSLVIRPITVRNVTLSGPYPDSPEKCSILVDILNPNSDAIASFNAKNDPLLKISKRDFGYCKASFDCSFSNGGGNTGAPLDCTKEFGHHMSWNYHINDLGIITLDVRVAKQYNLTVGATETSWSLHLRADRQNCGSTCHLDCGKQCGQCSNGVCSWGGFERIVDNINFDQWR